MAQIKTAELEGAALNWAVAKCEMHIGGYNVWVQADLYKGIFRGRNYSTDWIWGGPIIEREGITATPDETGWSASYGGRVACCSFAKTLLVAALRCYVASKLGDTVEVPF